MDNWIPKNKKSIYFTVKTSNSVVTDATSIAPDGYGSLLIKNTGDDTLYINDNIELLPGSKFIFDNPPYVIINEHTDIKFQGFATFKQALFIKSYYKEV